MLKNRFEWTFLMLTIGMVTLTLPVSAANDDQSDNPNAPTPLQLQKGDNRLKATTMAGDLEFVTLNVPDLHAITEIVLESYIAESDYYVFLAIQTGDQFKLVGDSPAVDTLVGWSYFGPGYRDNGVASLGTEDVSVGVNQSSVGGIVEQLTARDYTIMLQQDGDPTTYTLNFIVTDATAVTTSSTSMATTASQTQTLVLIFTLFAFSTSLFHKFSRSDRR